MKNELRILLRTLRESAKISVALTAKRAFCRLAYLAYPGNLEGAKYDRQPSEKSAMELFHRSGIDRLRPSLLRLISLGH